VELVCSYSNRRLEFAPLLDALGSTPRVVRRPEGTPTQIHRRIPETLHDRFRSDYMDGVPIKELAIDYRVSRETVFKQAARLNLPPRNPKLHHDYIEFAAALYEGGASLATIGAQFGVAANTVRSALLSRGVLTRPPSGF